MPGVPAVASGHVRAAIFSSAGGFVVFVGERVVVMSVLRGRGVVGSVGLQSGDQDVDEEAPGNT
jgi:hypothetical protein